MFDFFGKTTTTICRRSEFTVADTPDARELRDGETTTYFERTHTSRNVSVRKYGIAPIFLRPISVRVPPARHGDSVRRVGNVCVCVFVRRLLRSRDKRVGANSGEREKSERRTTEKPIKLITRRVRRRPTRSRHLRRYNVIRRM